MSPMGSICSANHYQLLRRSNGRCRSMSFNATLCMDGPDKEGAPCLYFSLIFLKEVQSSIHKQIGNQSGLQIDKGNRVGRNDGRVGRL